MNAYITITTKSTTCLYNSISKSRASQDQLPPLDNIDYTCLSYCLIESNNKKMCWKTKTSTCISLVSCITISLMYSSSLGLLMRCLIFKQLPQTTYHLQNTLMLIPLSTKKFHTPSFFFQPTKTQLKRREQQSKCVTLSLSSPYL